MKRLITALLDLILPNQCFLCKNFSQNPICSECLQKFPFKIKIIENFEGNIDKLISLMPYETEIRNLLTYVKFDSHSKIAHQIAEQIPLVFNDLPFEKIDYWIPVPLHPKKRKRRGFNQVEMLFEPFLKMHRQNLSDILCRKKNTLSLFNLNKKSRQEILSNVFELKNPIEDLKNKRVVLLDDIVTSGSTLNEIAKFLQSKGVSYIGALTICYKT